MIEIQKMTEQKREKISIFMDGESDINEFSTLPLDDELKAIWHRYHLITDVLHQRTPLNSQISLSQKISDSIKQEPTVLSPARKALPGFFKPLAGMAIAASVAVIAILGIQQYQSNNLPSENQTAQIQQLQLQSQPSNLNFGVQGSVPDVQTARPVRMEMQSDLRINRYILNHNEYQSNVGVQGVTPHIRLVTTDTNE
ncbi:MAG: sigma-E factor negative regulatory protein RseA [Gammaproteobacteria bacterium]|jgi:sigma-E factor negative regulatory protein RseA